MKKGEMIRLTHAAETVDDVRDSRLRLARTSYDLSKIYQEIEMDSPYVDSHGDTSMPDEAVGLHSHDFYELIYCRSTGLQYLLGTRRYRIQRGDIVYIPPGIRHRPLALEELAEPYRRYVLWISPVLAAELARNFPNLELLPPGPYVLRTAGTAYENIELLFRMGVEEAAACKMGWQTVVGGNTARLLTLLLRSRTQSGTLPAPEPQRELLDELLVYIENHLPDKITLTGTASHFHVSGSTIDQLFRRRMKVSFYRYVTKRRLMAACTLLNVTSAELAGARAGFGDYSSFYRAFKREYGVSPSQYRRLKETGNLS